MEDIRARQTGVLSLFLSTGWTASGAAAHADCSASTGLPHSNNSIHWVTRFYLAAGFVTLAS